MITLQQFKAAHKSLCDNRGEYRTEKEYKKAQNLAKKISLAVSWLETGITEQSITAQIALVNRELSILNKRFDIELNTRKEYEKKNEYAAKKRRIRDMRWVLNFKGQWIVSTNNQL